MVTTDTTCATCTHNKVCSLKKDLNETKDSVENKFNDLGPIIEITVSCKEYRKSDMFPSFLK